MGSITSQAKSSTGTCKQALQNIPAFDYADNLGLKDGGGGHYRSRQGFTMSHYVMSVEVREATRNHETSRRSQGECQKPLAAMHFIPVAALRKNVHLGNIVPVFLITLITLQILSRWHRGMSKRKHLLQ